MKRELVWPGYDNCIANFPNSILKYIGDRLFEVKFYIVSEHLPDDPDEFARTVAKGIVM